MIRTIYSLLCLMFFLSLGTSVNAQPDRWQQAAKYDMEIDFDVEKHQFKGKQTLVLTNNSPDALDKVFYHLYFNAFQPNSMMAVRAANIADPDGRMAGRFGKLKPNEIGYHKVKSLTHNGKKVSFKEVGTILEVSLKNPIPAGGKATFVMEFDSQVPVQIRRSGRDNREGISYSMSQWYPKMCNYDYQGWHANPYVGREFYGIWGDFNVKITIDSDYLVGAGGVLQNADQIGYGYADTPKKPSGEKATWHFLAENVHDFVWSADKEYELIKKQAADGPLMYFLYQPGERTTDNWKMLPEVMEEAFAFISKNYGKYPYPVYSFLQGGDGGMEYPMATLITGERTFSGLVGVSVHELIHSWYQMILGSNESLYAWMDEGFTSYASAITMNHLKRKGLIPGASAVPNPHVGTYIGYSNFNLSGNEEALSTHSDHFTTNSAYGVGSYIKGAIFLHQLSYIIGKPAFDEGMLQYFETWKYKHPNANDFVRIMEQVSGLELDWYREYWVNTTHNIDYAVKDVQKEGNKKTRIVLERRGMMPMPIDVVVTTDNGKKEFYTIPLRIMRGEKTADVGDLKIKVAEEDWPWTNPSYELVIPCKFKNVVKVQIDPSNRLADVNRENNEWGR
ncbi:MAG: M1 family metallopeptidase [Bacteroidota bacterium]